MASLILRCSAVGGSVTVELQCTRYRSIAAPDGAADRELLEFKVGVGVLEDARSFWEERVRCCTADIILTLLPKMSSPPSESPQMLLCGGFPVLSSSSSSSLSPSLCSTAESDILRLAAGVRGYRDVPPAAILDCRPSVLVSATKPLPASVLSG